jgi:hypothetical protein
MEWSSQLDSFALDLLPPCEIGRPAIAVDIGCGQITQALVITPRVVERDELGEAGFLSVANC